MRIVRSWPPAGSPVLASPHARIQDAIERVELAADFDYAALAGLGEDLIHLDWDTAAGPELLERFALRAAEDAERVLIGPTLTYPGSLFGADPVPRDYPARYWTAKVYEPGETQMRMITATDSHAHLWGFSLVYLPHHWLAKFTADHPGEKMGDGQFSGWYYRQAGPARLAWDCVPVHLNFPPPGPGTWQP